MNCRANPRCIVCRNKNWFTKLVSSREDTMRCLIKVPVKHVSYFASSTSLCVEIRYVIFSPKPAHWISTPWMMDIIDYIGKQVSSPYPNKNLKAFMLHMTSVGSKRVKERQLGVLAKQKFGKKLPSFPTLLPGIRPGKQSRTTLKWGKWGSIWANFCLKQFNFERITEVW